jgi:hypothetical protein
MMLKVLPITALVLGLSSGAALADRGRDHGHSDHRSNAVVRDHRGDWNRGGNWNRGNVVVRDRGNWNHSSRVIVRNEPRRTYSHGYSHGYYPRRPIYVSRPFIGHRYYNYYQRPALIIENYSSMPGYYWVTGRWEWSGYEWIWQPGHYEPDPNYGYYDAY